MSCKRFTSRRRAQKFTHRLWPLWAEADFLGINGARRFHPPSFGSFSGRDSGRSRLTPVGLLSGFGPFGTALRAPFRPLTQMAGQPSGTSGPPPEMALTQQSCYQPQSSGSTFRRPVERRTETALKDLPESETGIKPRRFRSARPESEIADCDPKASRAEPDRAQVQAGQGILATLRFVT